jgi:hypothetical protein
MSIKEIETNLLKMCIADWQQIPLPSDSSYNHGDANLLHLELR